MVVGLKEGWWRLAEVRLLWEMGKLFEKRVHGQPSLGNQPRGECAYIKQLLVPKMMGWKLIYRFLR